MAREGDDPARQPQTADEPANRLSFGGMARLGGIDFFGPNYASVAERSGDGIRMRVDHSRMGPPRSPVVRRVSRLPLIRSVFFWGRLLLQILGSVRGILIFGALVLALWLFTLALEAGGAAVGGFGPAAAILSFLAAFPVLPLILLMFAVMKLTSIGRYHGAEHKAVAAYERDGEVTLAGARRSGRIHPRCGTNILIYIIAASLIAPLVSWPPYAVLQFVLISEAWYLLGGTRASIAAGNFLQRYFTTSEPARSELEVAVESLSRLIEAEAGRLQAEIGKSFEIPARF